MNCAEAAEGISALFDGEPISREVAAHLSDCEECRVRLNEYAEMSAELRAVASVAAPQAIPEGQWGLAKPAAANSWLRKWRGTMRIPRFAFALMLIAIFALSGGLALVKARPGGNGPVLYLEFKVKPGDRGPVCSTETNREVDVCGFRIGIRAGNVWGSVRLLKREGERVKLSIKTAYRATTEHEQDTEAADAVLRNVSPVEYWLEPDEPMSVPVEGLGNILVFGELRNSERITSKWFEYEIRGRDGKMIMAGAVPPNGEGNPYYDADAGMSYPEGTVWFHVRMLERIGETEEIGVRALWHVRGEQYGDKFFETLHNMPERQFLYSPGEELKIPVEDYGNLQIKGRFTSTLPETAGRGMYPEWGKFRIDAPVLLVRGKEVLGRFDGGGGELSLDKSYFAYGQQDEGWYLFSAKPIEGAVEGTLTMNDIEFKLDGKPYSLFTGNPIVFGRTKIWIKHYASIKDADPTSPGDGWHGDEPRLAFGKLQNLTVE